ATTPPADLASLDVDTDGMGDTWELTYFGNISAKNGNADSDGGGAIDRVEFQMGTNPLDANDDPTVMPYFEDFESRTTGWYNVGMRLYLNYLTPSVNNKIRVIDTDHAEEESGFTKCLEILPPAGVSLLMGDAAGSNVVVTMYLKPTLMNDVDPELAATDSVGFLVRQDGTVRVYNGTQWSNTTFKVPTDGRWLGFGAHLDYNSKKWDLYVSTNEVYGEPMVRVASRLAMNTTASGTYLRCLTISNTAETATARLDDLSLNYMGHALVPGGTQDRLAAFEKRTRITEEETRMIMVPYEYSSGKDTLASNLGRDLARDCSDGDTIRVFFANLGGWGKFVRTSPGGVPSWEKVSGYGTVTTPIRRWLPIILTRQPGTTLATPVAWHQASQPLQNMPLYAGGIANGWNMGFWMKSTKNLNATPPAFNSAVQTGDEIRTESYPGVRIYYNNGWREGQALSSKQIRANEWFFFRNRSVNNTLNWSAE
ncbi:MAG: hypothetical protein N3G20_00935, partial [Verrucomicrobiae bacterium]|nr:hypothetical protein [Verrucomicrobiae bacterium]